MHQACMHMHVHARTRCAHTRTYACMDTHARVLACLRAPAGRQAGHPPARPQGGRARGRYHGCAVSGTVQLPHDAGGGRSQSSMVYLPLPATPSATHPLLPATPSAAHPLLSTTPSVTHLLLSTFPSATHPLLSTTPSVTHLLLSTFPSATHPLLPATPSATHLLLSTFPSATHPLLPAPPSAAHPLSAAPSARCSHRVIHVTAAHHMICSSCWQPVSCIVTWPTPACALSWCHQPSVPQAIDVCVCVLCATDHGCVCTSRAAIDHPVWALHGIIIDHSFVRIMSNHPLFMRALCVQPPTACISCACCVWACACACVHTCVLCAHSHLPVMCVLRATINCVCECACVCAVCVQVIGLLVCAGHQAAWAVLVCH